MIYLDSAIIDKAKTAASFGWVKGITTNPTLLNKSPLSPEETLRQLAAITSGELFYQLCSKDFDSMVAEGKQAAKLIGTRLVLKIPANDLGFRVTAHLSPQIDCSVTAIYDPAQAAIAQEAGAKYAIAYVNRATRLLGDGFSLVRAMAEIVQGSNTEILAASIKSPKEAVETLKAGADHLTLPLNILQQMTSHQLSDETFVEFNAKGVGINF